MTFRVAISALALVSALFLPGMAFAQATDRADVQRACAAARAAANQSLAEPVESETDNTAAGSTSSSDDPDPASRDNTDRLAGSLTAAQCREAGY